MISVDMITGFLICLGGTVAAYALGHWSGRREARIEAEIRDITGRDEERLGLITKSEVLARRGRFLMRRGIDQHSGKANNERTSA